MVYTAKLKTPRQTRKFFLYPKKLGRNRWSAPRLRGGGEQGNIALYHLFLPALYVSNSPRPHTRALPKTRLAKPVALLTTASHLSALALAAAEARRAPQEASPASPIRRFAHSLLTQGLRPGHASDSCIRFSSLSPCWLPWWHWWR